MPPVIGHYDALILTPRFHSSQRVWHNLVPIPPEVTVEKENAPTTNTTSQRSESIMRMKYALLERRFAKTKTPPTPSLVQNWCRSQFQYYTSSTSPPSFFENAGGAQVPSPVTSSMLSSLSNRWRSNHGALQKSQAVTALQHLLGFSPSEFDVDLNVNSTMIFKDLARICVQELVEGDEIVVSTSNHCANYDCWIEVRISDGSERDEKRRTFYHEICKAGRFAPRSSMSSSVHWTSTILHNSNSSLRSLARPSVLAGGGEKEHQGREVGRAEEHASSPSWMVPHEPPNPSDLDPTSTDNATNENSRYSPLLQRTGRPGPPP